MERERADGARIVERIRVITRHPEPCDETSRRGVLRALAASVASLALARCASLDAATTRADLSAIAERPTLLVATTRKAVNGGRKPWFGPDRGRGTALARAALAPPSRTSFALSAVGLGDWNIESVEPLNAQIGDVLAQATNGHDLLMYVHGFRNTFEGAALDAARLSDGIHFRGETMVFAWPSKSGLFDYVYDRESAMWSRDALEGVLEAVMVGQTNGRVHIVAHSMGTMLTLEALRQLNARYGEAAVDRIGAIVFASPDIDIDVFSSSIERMGPLAQRITVITATNDRALELSSKLAGGVRRVGGAEKAQLERLGLRVIDASQQGWGLINHDLFLSNPDVRQVVRRAIDSRTTLGA
jgi:esterase/lipase superfamily enzyme